MGRRRNSINDRGPVGRFAQALRDYHAKADLERERPLTFREMATHPGKFSHSVYAAASAGKVLPSQAVVEDYVRRLGGSPDEIRTWKERRLKAEQEWEEVRERRQLILKGTDVLRELYQLAKQPSYRALARESGVIGRRLPTSTVSNILTGKVVPRRQTAEAFISACLRYARRHRLAQGDPMKTDPSYWAARYADPRDGQTKRTDPAELHAVS